MIDLIRDLAAKRDHLAETKAVSQRLYNDWLEYNKDFLAQCEKEKEEVAQLEIQVREAAIAEYAATGNTRPVIGVEIKMFTRLNYSQDKALEWAIEHKVALLLNASAFERIAKIEPIDFVTKTETPKVTLAVDLDAALRKLEEK